MYNMLMTRQIVVVGNEKCVAVIIVAGREREGEGERGIERGDRRRERTKV